MLARIRHARDNDSSNWSDHKAKLCDGDYAP
jgi:hypothetical protein